MCLKHLETCETFHEMFHGIFQMKKTSRNFTTQPKICIIIQLIIDEKVQQFSDMILQRLLPFVYTFSPPDLSMFFQKSGGNRDHSFTNFIS